MSKTKTRILNASLALFNEKGLKNTTLQLIAEEVEISVGNLAYHYKNKLEIIAAHNELLEDQITMALSHFRNYPHFLDFQIQLEYVWDVLETYRFVFVNLGEIKILYPDTFFLIETFRQKLKFQIESRIQFHQNREALETDNSDYLTQLPETIANHIISTPLRALFIIESDRKPFFQNVWRYLQPVLSESGKKEWELLISPAIIS